MRYCLGIIYFLSDGTEMQTLAAKKLLPAAVVGELVHVLDGLPLNQDKALSKQAAKSARPVHVPAPLSTGCVTSDSLLKLSVPWFSHP